MITDSVLCIANMTGQAPPYHKSISLSSPIKKIYYKFYIGTDANVVLHYDNKLLAHLKNGRQCSDARKDCTEAPELLRRKEALI